MRHRHQGKYISRTPKGRTVFKRKPFHKQRKDLVYIDDDALEDYKKRAFAHELGHQHLFVTGEDDGVSEKNIPAIERKADKIGANILGMTVNEFNNPDVTFNDVVSSKRNSLFFGDLTPEEEEEESRREFEERLQRAKEEREEQRNLDLNLPTRADKEEIEKLTQEQIEALTSGELDELRKRRR